MSSTSLFINNPFLINQNTNIYTENFNSQSYDYTFQFNLSSHYNSITELFSNASFIQNVNSELVDINLTLKDTKNLYNLDCVTILLGNSNKGFSTLKPDIQQKFGDRLLEIIAHKIFGSGQAQSAISNDFEFYNYDGILYDHFNDSLKIKGNDIFNQYVTSKKYGNGNDIDNWINFNFDGLSFDFPLYFSGLLYDDPSLTNYEKNLLKNGPQLGGSGLVNGIYNIPILISLIV